ncbi:MAG: hypothetical protein RSB96_01600, partial [Oscillospiraceae bacterium]
DVINDEKYTYHMCAEYLVGGELIYSDIVNISGMPKKELTLIRGFQVSSVDQKFVALWDSNSVKLENNVLLLYTKTYPTHKSGIITQIEEVLENYQKVEVTCLLQGQAKFEIPKNSMIYITPCQTYENQVILGEPVKVTDIVDVENLTANLQGESIVLDFKFPNSVEYVAVAYRYDRYAVSFEDGTHVLYCSKAEYAQNPTLSITDVKQGTYYITVYCVGTNDTGERIFSNGVNAIIFNEPKINVDYTVKYVKPLLSSNCSLHITISSEKNIVLPRVMFIKKVGNAPQTILDGEVVNGIECETSLSGEITYKFPVSPFI